MDTVPAAIGRYQVRARLGQGGMGVLYLALDPAIERLIALKLLRGVDEELRERFVREARLAARLQHPNIVTIFDVGSHEGQPFIAMEYIAGETLAELIHRRAPLSLPRKLELLLDACQGLAYAHKNGIVHRDIKPANLMVSRDAGVLKVLDFGIARGGDSTLTQIGMLMGTPNYMAPEQVEGKATDQRADIFALGLVLYELLVYRQAFKAETPHAVLHQVLHQTPKPLRELDPALDPTLTAVVDRAIAKDPGARYQDLERMRADLYRLTQRLKTDLDADTLVVPAGDADAAARQAGRRGTDRHRLAERRAAQVATHLAAAEEALAADDPDAALAAAESAALLDGESVNVVEVLDRVKAAIDAREIAVCLAKARELLQAGELTEAGRAVMEALQIDRQHAGAQALRTQVDRAMEERERRRERARAVGRALAQAEESLRANAFDAALRATGEALAHDPENADALAFRARVVSAVEDDAKQAIADARAHLAAGRHAQAVQRLQAFSPWHTGVEEALTIVRREVAEIEQRRREEEEARRRAEEEAQRQAEEEARRRAEEEARRKAEEEARRRAEEEAKRKAEEEARRQAEEEARRKAEEEARRRAEEEAERQRLAEEVRQRADEERRAAREAEVERRRLETIAKRKAAEEAKRKAADEARLKREAEEEEARRRREAEEEARRAREAEEARLRAEAEAKQRAEAEARQRAEAEVRRKAEEEARLKRQAEDARQRADEQARRQRDAEDAERRAAAKREADALAKRRAEEKATRDAEEARRREEAKREADEKARRRAEEEARRAREEAEARARAEKDAQARRKADAEAKRKADAEAKRLAEIEARRLADLEATRRADVEAKRAADVEARRLADLEATRRAEVEKKQRADAEAKRRADNATRRADEEARRKVAREAREDEAAAVAVLGSTQPTDATDATDDDDDDTGGRIAPRPAMPAPARVPVPVPAAAAAPSPARAATNRRAVVGLGAAAAVMLAALVGWFSLRGGPVPDPPKPDVPPVTRPGGPDPTGPGRPGENQTGSTGDKPPGEPPAEPPVVPPVGPGVDPNVGTADPAAVDAQIDNAVSEVRRMVDRRQRTQALDALGRHLATFANAPKLQRVLDEMVLSAQREADRARAEAVRLQAPARAGDEYQRADAVFRESGQLRQRNRQADAIRGLWRAQGEFVEAARLAGERATVARVEPPPTSTQKSGQTTQPPVNPPQTDPPPTTRSENPPTTDPRRPDTQPPSSTTDDRTAIQQTLNRYVAAYASRSAAQVASVWRTITPAQAQSLDEAFARQTRHAITLSTCAIKEAGTRATAQCGQRREIDYQNAPTQQQSTTATFQLEKRGTDWVIVGVTAR